MDWNLPRGRVLSKEETRALLAAAQQGDAEARRQLVEANLRLVASIVQRFRAYGADQDDLFQVGSLGLIKAIDKFDLSFDVAFSTYAVPLIVGEIRHYLRENQPLRIGRALRDLALQAAQARERLTQELGRSPTADEIAAAIGAPREEVVMALDAQQPLASLDQPIDPDDSRSVPLGDAIPAEPEVDPGESLALAQILRHLSAEERTIVALRYLQRLPQTEVAALIRRSQAHVSRLEKRIIERLRQLWVS